MIRFVLYLFIAALVLSLGLGAHGAAAQGESPWSGVEAPDADSVAATDGDGPRAAGAGAVTKTFRLTIEGVVPEGESHAVVYATSDSANPSGVIVFCGSPDLEGNPTPGCAGDGTVYTGALDLAAGTEIAYAFGRLNVNESEDPEFYEEGVETLETNMTNEAVFAYGGDDDQQDAAAGDTVTKSFDLTLNGDVPAGDSFYVQYLEEGAGEDMTRNILFCGELIEEEPKPACEGDGAEYSAEVEFERGMTIDFRFGRHNEDYSEIEVVYSGTETLGTDFTNSAFFTYGAAGGDEQDGADDGADTGDDRDDAEVPAALPNTGAGGAAGAAGTALPAMAAAGALALARLHR